MILSVIKDYLVNSTFHGLRFIAQDGRHWSERVFWTICCLLSWFASAALIKSSWDSFQNNAVSFVVETTYLDFETNFPSVSVCEDDNMGRVYEKANEYFGHDHDCNLDEVLREIAYFKGSVYYIKEFCLSEHIPCPTKDYMKIYKDVRTPCENIFGQCKWKNETFDCCKHFLPTKTEWGICFTLSSNNEIPGTPDSLHLVSSVQLGLGSVQMELLVPTKVFMHPKSDVPYYNSMTTDIITPKVKFVQQTGIAVTDTENEPEVRQLSVSQRGCRFPDENFLTTSSLYSYSACVTECRMEMQLRLCNCTSHLMPNTDVKQHCDMSGILCLTKHYETLSVQKTPWGVQDGINCPCLPGCQDSEFNKIESMAEYLSDNKENSSIIKIFIYRQSSERYKRVVTRGRLDLVVSMGGTTSLLVGASLLSFAEFIYFFTLRLYNNRMSKKSSSHPQSAPILKVLPFTPTTKPGDKDGYYGWRA